MRVLLYTAAAIAATIAHLSQAIRIDDPNSELLPTQFGEMSSSSSSLLSLDAQGKKLTPQEKHVKAAEEKKAAPKAPVVPAITAAEKADPDVRWNAHPDAAAPDVFINPNNFDEELRKLKAGTIVRFNIGTSHKTPQSFQNALPWVAAKAGGKLTQYKWSKETCKVDGGFLVWLKK